MSNYDSNAGVVKQTQAAINAAGYSPPLTVDGAYGPKTKAGVKWFQGLHGLTQDGISGDQTVAATVAAPPAASGAIADLQSQIQQLGAGAGATPTVPSAPLVATPVVALVSRAVPQAPQGPLYSGQRPGESVYDYTMRVARERTAAASSGGTATSALATTGGGALAAPSKAGGLNAMVLPTGIGLVAGAAIGALVAIPTLALGALIGAGTGAAAGLGYSFLSKPAAGATMHGEIGEDEFCCDFGFDDDYGEPGLIGCEIGMPATMSTLKG